jgi:hypothetical protein
MVCDGVAEWEKDELAADIYPNPGSGLYSIRTTMGNIAEIYSATGILVHKVEMHAGENTFSIKEHSSGIYLVVIKKDHQRI